MNREARVRPLRVFGEGRWYLRPRTRSGSLYNLCWPDHVKLVYRVERLGCPVSQASAMLEQLGQYCSCTKTEGRIEMGRIVVSDNVSLDGVIQDPAGDEGFRVGGWVGRIMDRKELAKVTLDEALGTEALLLGRRSYDGFAARWPSRGGELALLPYKRVRDAQQASGGANVPEKLAGALRPAGIGEGA